ncbi:MAG: Rrf2 family transcriptional regulator [Chitinophagales bacterium]
MLQLAVVHQEILRALTETQASYAHPVCSVALARRLNLTPSYVREQAQVLRALNLVEVRRGRGGGYFLRPVGPASVFRDCVGWA